MKLLAAIHRRRLVALSALALLCALAGAVWVSERSTSSAASRQGQPRALGRTNPGSMLDFSLVMRLRSRELSRFLAALYDPRSPLFHHFIDAKTFGNRFGVSTQALQRVSQELTAAGVRITSSFPQRTALYVRAPAGVINHLFGVTMMDYAAPDGRRYHAPAGTPTVPGSLSGSVSAVAGLNGRFLPSPADVPRGGLGPGSAGLAYDLAPLYKAGITGQGMKIGIVSLAQYKQSDLDAFDQQFGLPPLQPQDVSPSDVGPATDAKTADIVEPDMDLEIIHEIAPQAQVFNYNGPNTVVGGIAKNIAQAAADGKVQVLSISWGECEQLDDPADVPETNQAIESAIARGISIFVATGDSGAYGCQRAAPDNHQLAVSFPASSPGVVGVGGTSLSVAQNGAYSSETPWEWPLEQEGSGGGLSVLFSRPSWQRALGVANRFSNGRRQLPDVSADADVNTGWSIVAGGQVFPEGGTSAATPFWAASMLLIEQYAQRNGVNTAAGLGELDPMLYTIASTPQPAPPFHDITFGTNRYYPATVGWDFATGLGSPDVWNLAQDVVSYLKAHGKK